jgi:hypothetical protein
VRQRGYDSAAPASAGDSHDGHTSSGAPPTTPKSAVLNTPSDALATKDPASAGASGTGVLPMPLKPPAAAPTPVAPRSAE